MTDDQTEEITSEDRIHWLESCIKGALRTYSLRKDEISGQELAQRMAQTLRCAFSSEEIAREQL